MTKGGERVKDSAKKRSASIALGAAKKAARGFFRRLEEDRISVYAAQSSFFIMISIVPFLMLILSLSNLLFPEFVESVFETVSNELPEKFSSLLSTVYNEIAERGSVSYASVTFIAMFWMTSRGVAAMTRGIGEVYKANGRTSPISEALRSVVHTLIMVFAVLLSLTVMVFGVFIRDKAVKRFPKSAFAFDMIISLRQVVFFIVMVLLFSLILAQVARYGKKKGADTSEIPLGFRAQIPGAAIAVVGWMVYSYFFSLYIEYFPAPSYLYGSLAAVILFMLWLYFCVMILLVGAEVNKAILIKKKRDAKKKQAALAAQDASGEKPESDSK